MPAGCPHGKSRKALFGILLLSGCGDTGTTPPPPPPVATAITISPSSVAFQALGDTEQLTATVVDQNGQVMAGAAVDWTTSTVTVASVSSAGVVTAVGNGTTSVTATSGSASANIPVTVEQVVAEVRVTPSVTEFASLGDTVRLTAEGLDANGNAVLAIDFDWSSNERLVATVDADGLVTAIGNGSATVTATSGALGADASVTVAQRVAEVVVAPAASTLFSVGDTLRLSAAALDALGSPVSERSFVWSSDDESVATVDSTGLVSAVRSGSVLVSASVEGAAGSASVTVAQLAVEVRMTPAALALDAIGDTARLVAEALDANGHLVVEAHYTWSSSNELVATVDSTGLVTATGLGSSTVRAAAGGAGANQVGSATVTVAGRVEEIRLLPLNATVPAIGDTVRLAASAHDADGRVLPGAAFEWRSSDVEVAAVDDAGLVTGRGAGLTTVTASAGGLSATTSIVVGTALPSVELVAVTEARSGTTFDVGLRLDMSELSHTAGAVAVRISFDPALVKYDPGRNATTDHVGAVVYGDAEVRIVISAPGGLPTPSTVATLPFRAVGAAGSLAALEMSVVQVIAAASYDEISHRLAFLGQHVRIRP